MVANLPYNVAVPVLLHLLEVYPSIRRVLVMVQLEVAERLAAALRFEFDLPYPGGRRLGMAEEALAAFSTRLGVSL